MTVHFMNYLRQPTSGPSGSSSSSSSTSSSAAPPPSKKYLDIYIYILRRTEACMMAWMIKPDSLELLLVPHPPQHLQPSCKQCAYVHRYHKISVLYKRQTGMHEKHEHASSCVHTCMHDPTTHVHVMSACVNLKDGCMHLCSTTDSPCMKNI